MVNLAKDEQMNKILVRILEQAQKKKVLFFCPDTKEELNEGFSSSDVSGFFTPTLKEYISYNIESFKEAYDEFGLLTAFKFLSLTVPWGKWTWTVDSSEWLNYSVVDDREKVDPNKYMDEVNNVTEEERLKYLNTYYEKVSDAIWVSIHDKTNFFYDYTKKPYGNKKGWTLSQVQEILEEWYEAIYKEKIKVKYKKGCEW